MSSYQKEYEKEIPSSQVDELCKAFDSGGKCLSDEIPAFRKKASFNVYYNE